MGSKTPWSLWVAFGCLIVYGGVVAWLAVTNVMDSGIIDPRSTLRAVVRVLGVWYLAGVLLARQRWAWAFGIVVTGILGAVSILAVPAAGFLAAQSVITRAALGSNVVGAACLLGAFVALMLPQTRDAFRAHAPRGGHA